MVEGSPTWVLSNHDVTRHVTRYGGGEVGLARAKAATLTMLALPGSAYLYQGEELGLEQVDVAPEFRQDPSWFRTGEPGRDGCRVPVPWGGSQAPYEFGPGTEQPWIPMPADWADVTVAAEAADPESTLAFYRAALAARRTFSTTAGDAVDLSGTEGDVLVMRRGPIVSVTNCGSTPVPLPAGELLVASGPLGTPPTAPRARAPRAATARRPPAAPRHRRLAPPLTRPSLRIVPNALTDSPAARTCRSVWDYPDFGPWNAG